MNVMGTSQHECGRLVWVHCYINFISEHRRLVHTSQEVWRLRGSNHSQKNLQLAHKHRQEKPPWSDAHV